MLADFFALAMRSPGRQRLFRRTAVAHVAFLAVLICILPLSPRGGWATTILGQLLLVAGIVEGAVLAGWRLTQLPKSQALEFLLVSPLRPVRVFLGEALAGVGLLGLVTLAGLPLLSLLAVDGVLGAVDLVVVVVLPFTWGALAALILATWAYEPVRWRRFGERVLMVLVLVYLVAGVLAGEKLQAWLQSLPGDSGYPLYCALIFLRDYNPFGAMRSWSEHGADLAWEQMLAVEVGSLLLLVVLLLRAAWRLEPHFHERHYAPAVTGEGKRDPVADRPLTWWAVKRVSEFSGRINIWLAGGFGLLYAAYALAGDDWPAWMGRSVFALADRFLGLGGLATALVLLAAVPAAFQYGLWDASAQDRCRRLELLLMTQLRARDYWHAAAAAAWRRGRGYFLVALVLWMAAAVSGQADLARTVAAVAASVLLWALYFAIGFRSFSRGVHANGLGMLLTVGLPLAAVALWQVGLPALGALLPPGGVYGTTALEGPAWMAGPILAAVLALVLARKGLRECDSQLHRWYDLHHGSKVMT